MPKKARPCGLVMLVVVLMAAAVACGRGSSRTYAASATLTEQIATAHFLFRYSPGDRVDTAWQ